MFWCGTIATRDPTATNCRSKLLALNREKHLGASLDLGQCFKSQSRGVILLVHDAYWCIIIHFLSTLLMFMLEL